MKKIIALSVTCILAISAIYFEYILTLPELSVPFNEEGELLFQGRPFVEFYSR